MTKASILVVDDEPQIRRVMRSVLTAENYTVTEARSGDIALQEIKRNHFDLILLDINMPGMSGLEVCETIRKTSEIPIIMLSVRQPEFDRISALNLGADDYVTKPFSMPELLARIRASLRRVSLAERGHTTLAFDNVEINLAARQVMVRGQKVSFTPKEFELLQYLAEHPNVILAHGKLLQSVWGPDYRDQNEYLHVFINKLRKKIEVNPSEPRHLITEPRVGYRFAADLQKIYRD